MDIQVGELVTFKKGLYTDEDGAIYRVLEMNGDRVVIELENTGMVIRPQSIAKLLDLEKLSVSPLQKELQIGRASCRERVCQYV